MTITIYTKPGCVQCKYTMKHLDEAKPNPVPYKAIDVTTDPAAAKVVENSGKTILPYVTVEKNGKLIDSWHGFKDDKVKGLTKDQAA